MNFAGALRRELADRAKAYGSAEKLPACQSYGEGEITCFAPHEGNSRHGNFMTESYRRILANPEWRKRLAKVHTQARRCLPSTARGPWMELDACTSSDALLMKHFLLSALVETGRSCGTTGNRAGREG